MPPIDIIENGIHKMISGIDASKAIDPHQISTRILKTRADEIYSAPTEIFRKSYSTGKCPTDWKNANIQAIFKKGSETDLANYCPVSLTSVTCNMLEHILH